MKKITFIILLLAFKSVAQSLVCSDYYEILEDKTKQSKTYIAKLKEHEDQMLFACTTKFMTQNYWIYVSISTDKKLVDPKGRIVIIFDDGVAKSIFSKLSKDTYEVNGVKHYVYFSQVKINDSLLSKISNTKVKSYKIAGLVKRLENKQREYLVNSAKCFLAIGSPFENDITGPFTRKKE